MIMVRMRVETGVVGLQLIKYDSSCMRSDNMAEPG